MLRNVLVKKRRIYLDHLLRLYLAIGTTLSEKHPPIEIEFKVVHHPIMELVVQANKSHQVPPEMITINERDPTEHGNSVIKK